jgi:hypothetical protein
VPCVRSSRTCAQRWRWPSPADDLRGARRDEREVDMRSVAPSRIAVSRDGQVLRARVARCGALRSMIDSQRAAIGCESGVSFLLNIGTRTVVAPLHDSVCDQCVTCGVCSSTKSRLLACARIAPCSAWR